MSAAWVVTAGSAGAAELGSPPRFESLADRERIVLVSDAPVAGAMADRRADGSVVVTVPRAAAGSAIAGRSFDGTAGADGDKTRVRIENDARGDARIEIVPPAGVVRVHAFASARPARLTIDLLREGAREPSEAAAGAAKAAPRAVASAPLPATGPPPAAAPRVAASAPGKASAQAGAKSTELVGPPRPSAAEEAAVAKAALARTTPPALVAAAPATPPAASVGADPPGGDAQPHGAVSAAEPAGAAPGGTASLAAAARPSSGGQVVASTSTTAPAVAGASAHGEATLVCRWRRVAGMPYCAPDPKGAPYVADLGTSELAGLLDRARSGPTLRPLAQTGPAEAALNADVALLRAAQSGFVLPVLDEYRQALRTYPAFADAARSRANVALIYHALGFAPELERMHRASGDPVAPFAGVLLADLWRDRAEGRDLGPLVDVGRKAGGITACLAERVAASHAADEERRDAFPAAFADLSKVCPRTILEDAETAWLRGRAMVLGGEASRAVGVLTPLESELPRRERPLLLVDVTRAHDAVGNAAGARATEERLARGELGRRAARHARVALAGRDAAEGKLAAIDARFTDMPLEVALQTRERADLIAVGELLRAGNEIAALGMLSERKVDARRLALAEQLLLARALREVGLLDQARRVVAGIGAGASGPLPDEYYEELGVQALARDDAPAALEVAEQWQAARGNGAPAGAIALRARARAAAGDARGATDTLEKELEPIDVALARDVSVELAEELLSADPALALRLAGAALADTTPPALEPARAAAALHVIAEAAEATGDAPAARAAFTRLAREHAGQPAAAGAAYRAARLAQAAHDAVPGAATAAKSDEAPAPVEDDALSKRLAAAGQVYAEVLAGMSQGTKP